MGLRQIADDLALVSGSAGVNWILVRDGRALTAIDAGYPGDAEAMIASIRAWGHRPADLQAVLLTHAHVDHLGGCGTLWAEHGVPTYAHPAELAQAHGDAHEQATPTDVLRRLWRPRMLAWATRLLPAGGAGHVTVPWAAAFPGIPGETLDLPGHPVPLATPGHTSGHCGYLIPGAGVIATGDALVTGHPLSRRRGPQLLPGFFAHDPSTTVATLEAFARADADTIAPGHGEVWRGDLAEAVDHARHTPPAGYPSTPTA